MFVHAFLCLLQDVIYGLLTDVLKLRRDAEVFICVFVFLISVWITIHLVVAYVSMVRRLSCFYVSIGRCCFCVILEQVVSFHIKIEVYTYIL